MKNVALSTVLTVSISLVLTVPATALSPLPPYKIMTGKKGIKSLGPYKPLKKPKVTSAIKIFGKPDSKKKIGRGEACAYRWPGFGLKITFSNFGGKNACNKRYGLAQAAEISGRNGMTNWQTSRGLAVGQPLDTLLSLYPKAKKESGGKEYALFSVELPYGAGKTPILSATMKDGAIEAFQIWIGAAGD